MIIQRKLMLLAPLLLCLYALTDDDYHYLLQDGGDDDDDDEGAASSPPKRHHHLAFVTALSRHPPSLRVFRLVAEGAFLLLCAAFALGVWEGASSDCSYGDRPAASGGVGDGGGGGGGGRDALIHEERGDRAVVVGDGRNSGGGARMTPEAVGELLFAPAPDSIATNAAWLAYREHGRRRRRRTRRKRKGIAGGIESNDGHDDSKPEDRGGDADSEPMPASICGGESGGQPHPPRPPSSASVLGAALDVLTLGSMFLILFTVSSAEGGRYIDRPRDGDEGGRGSSSSSWMEYVARIAAPLFPLTLFFLCALMLILPWKRRRGAWTVAGLTVGAPFYDVSFRDGFVGDVFTSTVRPLQDLAFTAFLFLPAGLGNAWWTGGGLRYTEDAADVPSERSWFLHTVVLPGCTLSP